MNLSVEFPNVVYREGPEQVKKLAHAIEKIGFDQIDMFDHVVMGHPSPSRPPGPYKSNMPILEAVTTLAFIAAATDSIGLGTEVLVLPQRQPTLTAKQVATLDTLSGGRIRLGVGVGWQESEYEALGESFATRGARMDDTIRFLRAAWSQDPVEYRCDHFEVVNMAMEPKPPQGEDLPIWVGGSSRRALRRAAELGDGWLGLSIDSVETGKELIETIKEFASEADRDWETLGFQAQISPPPRADSKADRTFYAEPARVAERAAMLKQAGFGWAAINATGVFLAGARSTDEMIDALDVLHHEVRREVGSG